MNRSLINDGLVNDEKMELIPITHLLKLAKEIDQFKRVNPLNGFQTWIMNDLYSLDVPMADFPLKSIILVAIPHPFYAKVEFMRNGMPYSFTSLVRADFATTENQLKERLESANYHIISALKLPLKRLAVHCGLAVYGRNNLCYINGMGSNFSLVAYFSDLPAEDYYWRDLTTAFSCTNCDACFTNCPTGAILQERFLIDNEKCLSYLNETGEPFPEWLPQSVHHCVYDCLKCQLHCPMNRDQVNNVVGPIVFTEAETDLLLAGIAFDKYDASLKSKAQYLGFDQWPDGIAKNLKALIELSDRSDQNNDRKCSNQFG